MRKILKQDKVHSRTAASLERKYRFEKNFESKVGRDDNDQVVDMVNTSGKAVTAEFDQVDGEHRVHFKGGVINLTSPSVERSTGVAWESKVLLLTFRGDKHKKYGLYAYGNSIPIDPDADADDPTIGAENRYWVPSSSQSLYIEEITEQGETNA